MYLFLNHVLITNKIVMKPITPRNVLINRKNVFDEFSHERFKSIKPFTLIYLLNTFLILTVKWTLIWPKNRVVNVSVPKFLTELHAETLSVSTKLEPDVVSNLDIELALSGLP